ncbi:MAG: membrane-associated phospholipid phosphatase [Gammaproteobacteria bacterium]|jgi:membrane-associated phospholipid phosphatase
MNPYFLTLLSERHARPARVMRWKPLAIALVAVALIYFSWFMGASREAWDALDLTVFHFVNDALRGAADWQVFWAHANRHMADLIAVGLFSGLYLWFVLFGQHSSVLHRACQGVFAAAVTTGCVLLSEVVHQGMGRVSPSLAVDGAFRLGDAVSGFSFKYSSQKSFPGDHGIALICLATMLWVYARWRVGILGVCIAVAFVLPRVVVGAHWASDIGVGSVGFSLAALALLLLTPAQALIVGTVCSVFERALGHLMPERSDSDTPPSTAS